MKKQLFTIATGLSLGAAALLAQGGDAQSLTLSFQAAQTMQAGGGVIMPVLRGNALVTGSPFSAKEVTRTVQTLGDGTQLENTHTTMYYRDSLGRVRTEPGSPEGPILIVDPVAAVRITMTPATKTATRANAPGLAAAGRGGTFSFDTTYTVSDGTSEAARTKVLAAQLADEVKATVAARQGTVAVTGKDPNRSVENLGFQLQNGVLAEGTRTTLTIPQGQIGNNRDIHVVNERWYSKDLQMLVKSINTDPRYGTTTYDLQNISQNAPDPTLFQIPTGYTVTEGGRGGRGGVVAK